MKAVFNKVAIVGTGLIGGSLALAIKKRRLAKEVVGVSRHKQSLVFAKKMGAIDRGSLSLDIIKDADLLVLATPVNTIKNCAQMISRIVTKDCIVTDVGSTKQEIVSHLERIFPNFVGAHPLAGSEKRGILNAQRSLFQGSLCIITPTRKTNLKALKLIRGLWKKVGASTIILSPAAHDKILSFISHLPHVAAFSLIGSVPQKLLKFGSSGLKDTTRIAASDSGLWAQVLLSNKNNILKAMAKLQDKLSGIKKAIQANDENKLRTILKQAKAKRDRLC